MSSAHQRDRKRGGGNKGPKRQNVKEVSADYEAESEDLKLYSKITGLSDETAERLKRRSEVII